MKHYFNPSLRDIDKSFLSLQVGKASVATHNQKSQKALFDKFVFVDCHESVSLCFADSRNDKSYPVIASERSERGNL